MDIQLFILLGSIAVTLLLIVRRTARGHYGKIQPSREVAEAYEGYRVESHLTYYSSGSDIYPTAVIGIGKTWTLASDLWKPRDLSPPGMREMVQNMRSKSAIQGSSLFGFDIFDHQGVKIGNCFSVLEAVTTVKITGKKTVVIHTPSLDSDRNS